MAAHSIWLDAASVNLAVYTSTNEDFSNTALWSGVMALGGSATFADEAGWDTPPAQLMLSVDLSGLISLSSDIDLSGGSGRKFLVVATPVGVDMSLCQWAQTNWGDTFAALYADTLAAAFDNSQAWEVPVGVPAGTSTWIGFAGGSEGF